MRLGRQADVLDWVTICQCLMFLDNAEELAKILHTLLTGSEVAPSVDELECMVPWQSSIVYGTGLLVSTSRTCMHALVLCCMSRDPVCHSK